ncbi:hypothetical protein B0A48_17873 [Cryoendolithus antarcticus]|uniref:Chitin-binding type-1 domain-containing protein n=1 Tax=Cryoendolithus antarcticus TaxID=1507870 RepID=A0A1V8SAI2_9PEZI|nr:hypothetical protein B0A48_17873 [Cryoendolithus antarcticus]
MALSSAVTIPNGQAPFATGSSIITNHDHTQGTLFSAYTTGLTSAIPDFNTQGWASNFSTSISAVSNAPSSNEPIADLPPTVAADCDISTTTYGISLSITPPMKNVTAKCFAGFLIAGLSYIVISGIEASLTANSSPAEAAENLEWIAGGKLWIDRQMCHWFGACGLFHMMSRSGWTWTRAGDEMPKPLPDWRDYWTSGNDDSGSWSKKQREAREIPQYVWDHAPYVHLFSGEQFWPCDLAEHLVHTSPRLNYTVIEEMQNDRNLTNLNELNGFEGGRSGRFMYLQSDDNVEERPKWLGGSFNKPDVPYAWDTGEELRVPDLSDLKGFDLQSAKEQALLEHGIEAKEVTTPAMDRVPSQDGRCGGSSGYTCAGSSFGQCCSIYGWCGVSQDFCGDACDALAGNCPDPLHPPRPIHRELRRKRRANESYRPTSTGRSTAPAILVVVPKEDGIVDAFWFFFYSYNLGNVVFNVRFGNHVGDWEHTAIRFKGGKPHQIFLSEHNFGEAYSWGAVEKYISAADGSGTMIGTWSNSTASRAAKRPVVYSATGTHAMYGTPGLQPYVLPWGILHDQTDRGPLWDPALNARSFVYNATTHAVLPSTLNPAAPVGWFNYAGHWGDKYYPLSDPRQYRFAGQYHYVNGPTGPKFKNLGRGEVCQGRGPCKIRDWLGGHKGAERLPEEEGDGVEEGGLPGGNSTEEA